MNKRCWKKMIKHLNEFKTKISDIREKKLKSMKKKRVWKRKKENE